MFFIGQYNLTSGNTGLILGYNATNISHHTTAYISDCQVTIPSYAGASEPIKLNRYDYTGSTRATFINGGSLSTTQSFSATLPVWSNANVGIGFGTAYGYIGNIHEIIFYNVALTSPQQQAIEGYLAQKWGLVSSLPANHPGLTQTYYNGKVYQPQISLKPAPYANYFPLSIGGCTFWLDATKDTTSSGSYITTIPDWSGSSITLLPYAANTISLAGNTLNGLSVYNFGTGMASNASFFWGTTFTQFVVVKGTGNWLSCTFNGTNYNNFIYAGNWNLMQVNIVPTTNLFAVNDSSVAQGTSVFTTTTGGTSAWTIFCLGYVNGSTQGSNYTLNGTSRTTQTGTPASGTPANYQFWLNGRGGSSFDTSLVAELIHFNVNLTASQRQQVEGYLAWKWGLQSSLINTHPYYSAPPLQYTRGAILGAPIPTGIARLPPVVATGGTITFSGRYKIHTFTTVGSTNFTITSPYVVQVQALIVGGGGGGGGDRAAGGGGGGLIFLSNTTITPGTYAVTVGDGGLAGWWGPNGGNGRVAGNGGNSIFNGNIAIGGGGAGQHQYYLNGVYQNNGEPYYGAGRAGGSGGGGAGPNPSYPTALGGSPTVGQGYAGGSGYYNGSICCAGGGGGAGGPGGNGLSAAGGAGGPGLQITIGGTTAYYAGGGGGAAAQDYRAAVGGAGGVGGGGQADQSASVSGVAGTNGLGGGGGGAGNGSGWAGSSGLGGNVAGFAGGSGVVIIAYDYL
jgi:hypothetical protein